MIDAAKVRRFLQPCKKNNLANGSVLLGTVFKLINPYSNGTYSMSLFAMAQKITYCVLILFLMEHTL